MEEHEALDIQNETTYMDMMHYHTLSYLHFLSVCSNNKCQHYLLMDGTGTAATLVVFSGCENHFPIISAKIALRKKICALSTHSSQSGSLG